MTIIYPRWGMAAVDGAGLIRHIVGDDDAALCGKSLAVIDLPPERIYQIDRVCHACCNRLVRSREWQEGDDPDSAQEQLERGPR